MSLLGREWQYRVYFHHTGYPAAFKVIYILFLSRLRTISTSIKCSAHGQVERTTVDSCVAASRQRPNSYHVEGTYQTQTYPTEFHIHWSSSSWSALIGHRLFSSWGLTVGQFDLGVPLFLVGFQAVYNNMSGNAFRRNNMTRLHVFPGEEVYIVANDYDW